MEFRGFAGLFYKISDLITMFTGSNLLWALFNLPLLYLVFSMLFVQNSNQLITLVVTMLILAPFIFFPATTAMFGVIRKRILGEDIKLMQSFWRYYKENYGRSMVGGLLIGFMWIVLIVDYYFFTAYVANWFMYPFLILALFLFVFTLHFFSLTVHVDSKLKETFKVGLLLTLGNPLLTLGLGVITGFIIYVSFQVVTFLIPFFMGSLISYLSFLAFYKFFMRFIKSIGQTGVSDTPAN
ncbi:DUF624 domain-containing protein [Virgibacillus dakarensis]|nr:DUF624 domain-containing protein [Virgibacillus dakarensis]